MAEPVVAPVAKPAAPPNGVTPPAPVAEPPKPAAPDPEAIRAQFSALTEKEKKHVAAQKALGAERAALQAEREKFRADLEEANRFKAARERAKRDPDPFLKETFGDDWYRSLSEFALEKRPPPSLEVADVREQIKTLEQQLAAQREEAAKQERARIEQEQREALQNFNTRVVETVRAGGEKYELINALGYHNEVPALIEQHWQKQAADGIPQEERKILATEEAAQMVEDWLLEQHKKVAASKKLLTSSAASVQAATRTTPEGISPGARGSIADLNGTSAKAAPAVTEEDRIKRAFAAYDASLAARKK